MKSLSGLQGGMLAVLALVVQLGLAAAQIAQYDPTCPKNWVQYEDACYRFVRSPVKRREAAREACQVSTAANCCSPLHTSRFGLSHIAFLS